MITYQLESWQDYRKDIDELWQEHYEELAMNKRKPMKPHEEFYVLCERLGMLQLLTAREAGKIIGYCITVVKAHPHYADILCGFEDSYYLSQAHRKGMAGVRLIKETEKYLRQRGAKEVIFMEIASKSLTNKNGNNLFKLLGYKNTHTVWTKWLGE